MDCSEKNADVLYKAKKRLSELSYEERKSMGLSGRKYMEEVFNKKKVVEEMIKEFVR